jgi:hypothetical protein
MSGYVPADREEAKRLATDQAFTSDGRTIVHSVSVGGPFMLGADWDLDGVLTEIDNAEEVMWFDDFMGHNLATKRGLNVYKFEVKR